MTTPISALTAGAPAAPAAASSPAGRTTDAAKQAKEFEKLLLGQLTKTLVDSAMPEDSSSAASNAYRDLLPDALTEALMSGGGIGLAKQLEEGMA